MIVMSNVIGTCVYSSLYIVMLFTIIYLYYISGTLFLELNQKCFVLSKAEIDLDLLLKTKDTHSYMSYIIKYFLIIKNVE